MRDLWLASSALLLSACLAPAGDCRAPALEAQAWTESASAPVSDVPELAGEPEGDRARAPRGFCASPRAGNAGERVKPVYTGALRGRGSAPSLRGRVALVTVLVDTPRRAWSRARRAAVERAGRLTRELYLREARRYEVGDLSIDLHTLDATAADVALPALARDRHERLLPEVMTALDHAVRDAAAQALGASLEDLAAGYRARGYRSVAFVAAFPFDLRARDFALSESAGSTERAELAFVFAGASSGALSYTMAHESLHLFGAEDLYALDETDPADRRDLMQVYCASAGASVIAGTTAWAIGWREKPPVRSYRIAR